MQTFLFILGRDDPAFALGAMVAATPDLPAPYRKLLRKGRTLAAADLPALIALAAEQPGLRLSLLRLDQSDVDESSASHRLATAVAGPGVQLRGPSQGKMRLVARHNGLLVIDRSRLAALNNLPDVSIYTLFGFTPVAARTVVAEAKITPLSTHIEIIQQAERLAAGDAPLLDVLRFQSRTAALLARERLDAATAEKVARSLENKLSWFGSNMLPQGLIEANADPALVAQAMQNLLDCGVTLLLTAGGSASDPLDATIEALKLIGAEPPRIGVPVHPGSLLWVSWKDEALVVGVPSCGALSEHTSFDIFLPRLLAFGRNAMADLAKLGEGGLLTRGMQHRFPPYDGGD